MAVLSFSYHDAKFGDGVSIVSMWANVCCMLNCVAMVEGDRGEGVCWVG